MCQLTFVNFHNKSLNSLFATTQAFANTLNTHKDGVGVFGKSIWKTQLTPWNCLNFADLFSSTIDSKPVILHVRNASMTNNVRIVDAEHAHPFETKNFVLAHNGSLELRKKEDEKKEEYKNMIDSQIFLSVLDKKYNEGNKDFVTAINSALNEFYGKFAFLIYDKNNSIYYAVRGSSATLFHLPITINKKNSNQTFSGYILNTEKKSITDGIVAFSNILFLNGFEVQFEKFEEKIKLLEEEKIFRLDDKDVVEIGDAKEEKRPIVQATSVSRSEETYYNRNWGNYGNSNWDEKTKTETEKVERTLWNYMVKFNCSIYYLDAMAMYLIDKPLSSFNISDFKKFFELLFTIDLETTKTREEKLWTKVKSRWVNDVLVHKENKLCFPWMYETEKENFKKILELQQ